MSFPRIHVFEFEDQRWFPTIIRDLATDYLSFIQATFRLEGPIIDLLMEALRKTGCRRIIDLCSGSGGPLLSIQAELAAAGLKTHVILTDRFPNLPAFQNARQSRREISFISESVDAKAVPSELEGFRTIFNSFHHFAKADAAKILRRAVEARQPIGIFEYPERSGTIILLTLVLTPLLTWVFTPFIRPFRLHRLFFTYLIPLVPFVCWWDGVVSHLRAYTADELAMLATEVKAASYEWRAGKLKLPGLPGHLTHLLGLPR
jgi:hypothetical protein